jgi:hypothetical protein
MATLEEAKEEVSSISNKLIYLLGELNNRDPTKEDFRKLNEDQRGLADTSRFSREFGTEPYGGEEGLEDVKRLIKSSSDYILKKLGDASDIYKLMSRRLNSFSKRLEACLLAPNFST